MCRYYKGNKHKQKMKTEKPISIHIETEQVFVLCHFVKINNKDTQKKAIQNRHHTLKITWSWIHKNFYVLTPFFIFSLLLSQVQLQ